MNVTITLSPSYDTLYLFFGFFLVVISTCLNLIVVLTYKFGTWNKNNKDSYRNEIPKLRQRRFTEVVYNNENSPNKFRRLSLINHASPDENQYINLKFLRPENSFNNRRSLCSYFTLALGLCDLYISLINIPLNFLNESEILYKNIHQIFSKNFLISNLSCKIAYYLYQIPLILEIEILLMIAFDRYSSVFRSVETYFFDKKTFKIVLILAFMVSLLLSTPNLFLIVYESNHSASNLCLINTRLKMYYTIYKCVLLALFISSFSIILFCYIRFYRYVYTNCQNQREEKSNDMNQGENFKSRRISCPVDLKVPITSKMTLLKTNIETEDEDNLKSLRNISTNVKKRLRRLSENSNFDQNVNSIPLISVTMRRHTSRRYQHSRTGRVLSFTILAMIITWTPYWLHFFYDLFDCKEFFLNKFMAKLLKNMYLLNYILNPIFYSFVNKRFRKAASNLFRDLGRSIRNCLYYSK
ncbi:unnamed protein product [Brachionus calyciflorus]|uniref:G-protein coupled receptors family 1 profile domain-containing protein n=1 Tax=Brachionus calyciflorus TaxID=104777 RepID=A0A813N2X0_9BILA|nr:unnamed protein product [Brachionus calyciflorus]